MAKRKGPRGADTSTNMWPVVRDSVEARKNVRDAVFQEYEPWNPPVRYTVPHCDDCRALTAFHATRSKVLQPAYSTLISFNLDSKTPPKGKRAVIEFVTALISLPSGEYARLRLHTSLGREPSNFDFVLTPQGTVAERIVLVATHSVRVYTDHVIDFSVNRDNAETTGRALVTISGYLVDQ